jgi:DnaA-homolog protein
MSQLPLALGGLGPPDFEHFWPGADALALSRVQALALNPGADQLLLLGPLASGKTHLLMACCDQARTHGYSVAYLPLARLDADALQEPVNAQLVAVDDADRALTDRATAEWLFGEINRQHDHGRALLLAMNGNPTEGVLADLVSRLARSEVLRLASHDDPARRAILLHRANQAGIPLDEAAADYLLRHHSRDLRALLLKLAELDREALARGRRITVPLLREVLT